MVVPDNPASLLYATVLLKDNFIRYGGYHRELFSQKFSILEEALIVCTRCQGVKRDASMFQGVATCRNCCYNPDKAKPVKDIRDLVSRLPMKCPLYKRGCTWSGSVIEGESHLLKCKELLCICPNECGVGVTSKSIGQHSKACKMREIPCELCGIQVRANKLEDHLVTCTLFPIQDTNCNTTKSELPEHLSTHSNQIPVANEIPNNATQTSAEKTQESTQTDIVLLDSYASLERVTTELKDRILRLERKNEILTNAIFIKPELITFDKTTGRFLEGFKWSISGIGAITKRVCKITSPTFYISYQNIKIIGDVGMISSIGFSVTRVEGTFDEISGTNTLSYYRCEVVSADGGEPLVLTGRINHKLELKGICQPFLFIDLSVLLDELYCLEDCITLNMYFYMTH